MHVYKPMNFEVITYRDNLPPMHEFYYTRRRAELMASRKDNPTEIKGVE